MRPKLSLNNFVVDAFDNLSMNRLKNSLRFVFANAVKQSRRLKLDCFAALAKTRFVDCVQFYVLETDNSGRTPLHPGKQRECASF